MSSVRFSETDATLFALQCRICFETLRPVQRYEAQGLFFEAVNPPRRPGAQVKKPHAANREIGVLRRDVATTSSTL